MAARSATLGEPSAASIEPFCAQQRHEQQKDDGHVPQIVCIALGDPALREVHVLGESGRLGERVVVAAGLVGHLAQQACAELGLLDVGPLVVREERATRRALRVGREPRRRAGRTGR